MAEPQQSSVEKFRIDEYTLFEKNFRKETVYVSPSRVDS